MLKLELSQDVQDFIKSVKSQQRTLGFVPTMGALHEGHLSLISKARKENDVVVASIYVNPLQFNNKDDYKAYPRVAVSDSKMLEEAGCSMVFIPDDSIIQDNKAFTYDPGYLDTVMEGHYRPGHFKGVAYIVHRLFDIVQPDKAYFGEKDYQQLAVIRKLNNDFNMGIEIIACPTVREADGLAMSSRNARLTTEERRIASEIYKNLEYIKGHISTKPIGVLKKEFNEKLQAAGPFVVEYVEICDAYTLEVLDSTENHKNIVVCTAVFLGHVRLIDNIKINL